MSCAPRKSSTFALQSRLRDELVKDCDRDLSFLFAQDPPLFADVPSLPELSTKSDSDSESSDSDDDVDPYQFHAGYLVTPEDLHSFDDVPYMPTVDLREFTMLPFDDPASHFSYDSPTISYDSPTVSYDSPTISYDSPSIPGTLSPYVELSPEDISYEDIGSDADAEGDSDYDPTEEEEDYTPEFSSKKRRASSQLDRLSPELTSFSPSTSTYSSSSRASSVASTTSSKRPRISFPSRNVQATSDSNLCKVSKSDPWACPFEGCPWVQRNRRSPDLKRHVKTHSRNDDEWVCCGIDADKAKHYERDASEKPYDYKGKPMVGGCMKTFARRDALKRHLDNQNIRCVGDLNCYFD